MERKYLTAALRDARLGQMFVFLAESPIILFSVEMHSIITHLYVLLKRV